MRVVLSTCLFSSMRWSWVKMEIPAAMVVSASWRRVRSDMWGVGGWSEQSRDDDVSQTRVDSQPNWTASLGVNLLWSWSGLQDGRGDADTTRLRLGCLYEVNDDATITWEWLVVDYNQQVRTWRVNSRSLVGLTNETRTGLRQCVRDRRSCTRHTPTSEQSART